MGGTGKTTGTPRRARSRWCGWTGRRGSAGAPPPGAGPQGPGDEEGQATLEYLLVFLAVAAVVAGLSAFVRMGSRGSLGRLATRAASHAVGGRNPGDALLDVFMY